MTPIDITIPSSGTGCVECVDPPPLADEVVEHLVDRPGGLYNAILTEHFVLESARGITEPSSEPAGS